MDLFSPVSELSDLGLHSLSTSPDKVTCNVEVERLSSR